MRIFILTACSILFLLSAQAQQKCRYEIDKIDKFTDDIMRLTRAEKLWRDFYEEEFISCAAVRKNNQRGILFAYYAHEEYLVEEGDSLMLLLGNDEILTLHASTHRLAERFSDQIYFANVFYALDNQQIELLMSQGVKAVRQYYKGGFFEREIKEKKQTILQELLGCVE